MASRSRRSSTARWRAPIRGEIGWAFAVVGAGIAFSCIELNPRDPIDDGRGGAGASGAAADGGAGADAGEGAGATPQGGVAGETGGGGPVAGSAGEASGGADGGTGTVGGTGGVAGTGGTGGTGAISDAGGVAGRFGGADPENPPTTLALSGSLGVHDPSVMLVGNTYYLFYTGPGITTKRSTDLLDWQETDTVFTTNPAWIATLVPAARDLWAPDIAYFNGVYHVYYSASSFGSNRSCIGHATQATIDGDAWVDQGPVICSNVEATPDDWNAIDPNVVLDGAGTPWLAFGSFWGGLKLVKLGADGKRADDALHAIAARDGARAIEAPFIIRRGSFFYLFASFDSCCRGLNSTYNLRVGRSTYLHGPYVDADGVSMLEGGGSLVLSGTDEYRGPGHNAVLVRGDEAFNVYHAYGAPSGGPVLRISGLVWDGDGWPLSAGP